MALDLTTVAAHAAARTIIPGTKSNPKAQISWADTQTTWAGTTGGGGHIT